jgi:hypothetical protein
VVFSGPSGRDMPLAPGSDGAQRSSGRRAPGAPGFGGVAWPSGLEAPRDPGSGGASRLSGRGAPKDPPVRRLSRLGEAAARPPGAGPRGRLRADRRSSCDQSGIGSQRPRPGACGSQSAAGFALQVSAVESESGGRSLWPPRCPAGLLPGLRARDGIRAWRVLRRSPTSRRHRGFLGRLDAERKDLRVPLFRPSSLTVGSLRPPDARCHANLAVAGLPAARKGRNAEAPQMSICLKVFGAGVGPPSRGL